MTTFEKEDQLYKYVSYAVIFHIMTVLLMGGSNQLLDLNPFKVKFKDVNIVKSAVKIDVVALPKHTLKELEKIDRWRSLKIGLEKLWDV